MRSSTILILIAFTFIASENCVRDQTRVIGGKLAALGMFPYQAYLMPLVVEHIFSYRENDYKDYFSECGGSLISENFVITAAHCLKQKKPLYYKEDGSLYRSTNETIVVKEVYVLFGVTDLYNLKQEVFQGFGKIDQSHLIIHPGFYYKNDTNDPIDVYNDIALIRLPRPVETNGPYVKPIQLPAFNEITMKGNAIVVGFGYSNYPHDPLNINKEVRLLRYVNVETLTNLECEVDEPTQICTRARKNNTNVGACFGDSGGPLVLRSNGVDKLIGITSYAIGEFCIQGNPNSHFTRITSYLEWIHENTKISKM